MNRRIYLDHAATTPILPAAQAAMVEAMAKWANPSSPHAEGRAARAAIASARARIKAALDWPHELIFVSGASEAARIAVAQSKVSGHVVSAVEHDSIAREASDAAKIGVDRGGIIAPEAIPDGALVAIQTVNSETGVVQRAAEIAMWVRENRGVWLADAAQSAGKLPLPDADLLIISGHKLGGPPGIGALLVKDLAVLRPSGGQEKGYRGGTENLPAVLGFAAALETRASRDHLPALRLRLDRAVVEAGGIVVAQDSPRLPEIASYRLPGTAAAAQLIALDLAGISVSAGSACSSGTLKASPVLLAMGWSETEAREVIRVSLAPETSREDVEHFLKVWTDLAARRRAA